MNKRLNGAEMKRKQRLILQGSVLAIVMFAMQAGAQNRDPGYSEKVRQNASTFHKNFSTGEFDKNGSLVNEKIYVNSNNAIVIGRDKFVQRIKRFSVPFPKLSLRDRIVIVDENQVGLLYIMQGVQDGPYGPIPASGNKINVYAAEFFTMDDSALMKELLTITQLDQLTRQIKGVDKVEAYEEVSLLSTNKKTNAAHKKILKNALDGYVQNFNTRDWKTLAAQFAKNVNINVNGKQVPSVQALVDMLEQRITLLSDMTYHLDRNVVEGDRGAIAYTVNAIHTPQGENAEAKTVMSREGIHFRFNADNKIEDMVIIYNGDDISNQLR